MAALSVATPSMPVADPLLTLNDTKCLCMYPNAPLHYATTYALSECVSLGLRFLLISYHV
jgi:hypothetical protein